jgi:Ca-activated chloride channel family protein
LRARADAAARSGGGAAAPPTNPGGAAAPGPGIQPGAASPEYPQQSESLDDEVAAKLSALGYLDGSTAGGGSAAGGVKFGRRAAAGAVNQPAAAAAPAAATAMAPADEYLARESDDDRDSTPRYRYLRIAPQPPGTELYIPIVEQGFQSPWTTPFSTFGVDVDTASYSNVRRFLNNGQLPPADAVRIEELVNYFRYDDPGPAPGGECPFGVTVDVTDCPWAPGHRLARVALKGREVPVAQRSSSNLVFLLDVSGSMSAQDKLPLLVASMKLLTQQLDERDRVAIVTYAGAAGLVLDSTTCDDAGRARVLDALDRLSAGGSTAGAAGIQLAYQVAARNLRDGGTNRVILATDGDFNVGITDRTQLQSLIEDSARTGVFLTVLGFGEGNLKDGTAELLADKGNGQYCYIDSLDEGRRVLVQQMAGTLLTIAKDVKLQVEFNPAQVQAYRLVGYENRALAPQDFKDDRKDAGDIGAGHSVVALYELVPPGAAAPGVDAPRYQQVPAAPRPELVPSDELLTVKLRWKEPAAAVSTGTEVPVRDGGGTLASARADVKFSAAVAAFGLLLRDSEHVSADRGWLWEQVRTLAEAGRGADPDGWRAEFGRLTKTAKAMKVVGLSDEQRKKLLQELGYLGDDRR